MSQANGESQVVLERGPLRCPVCKARDQGNQCRRCKADLSLLMTVEEQRREVLALAMQCIHDGRWRRAADLIDGALALRDAADARRLRAVMRLLRRDFVSAWESATAAND